MKQIKIIFKTNLINFSREKLIFLLFGFLNFSFNIYSVDLLITTSGTYMLSDDILSSGDSTNGTIKIQSSYVTLDLNGCFIKQTTNTLNCAGIIVDTGCTDVTIKNGTIYNFTGTGIAVQSGCQKIILDNILTDSCLGVGICLQAATSNPVTDSYVKNCRVMRCSGTDVLTNFSDNGIIPSLWLINNTRTIIDNCTLSLNGTPPPGFSPAAFFGCISLNGCNSCLVQNTNIFSSSYLNGIELGSPYLASGNASNGCVIRNVILNAGFFGNFGFNLISGQFNLFQDCIASKNSFTAGFAVNDSYNTVERCRFVDNSGGITNSFIVSGAITNINFIDCYVLSNNSTGSLKGFSLLGNVTNSLILRCLVANNISIATTAFSLTSLANNNEIRDCEASNNISSSSSAIGLSISTSNCMISGCKFFRNNGNTDANSFGISNSGSNNLFVQNLSYANGPTSPLIENQLSGVPVGSYSTPGRGGAGAASGRMNTMRNAWTNLRLTN